MKKILLKPILLLITIVALCQAAIALPTVNTSKTTVLSGTSVEVEFYLNWNLETPTVLSIQYSTNSNFTSGLQTKTITPIPSQSGTQIVKATIDGLTTNTLYYYRVRAGSNIGESYTATSNSFIPVQGFVPTAVFFGGSAADQTSNSIKLGWQISARNSPTTFSIYAATDYAFTQNVKEITNTNWNLSGNITTDFADTVKNLTAGTTYYFKIVAINNVGTTVSEIKQVATLAASPVVSNLTATTTETSITATFNLDSKGYSVSYVLQVANDSAFTSGVLDSYSYNFDGVGNQTVSTITPLTVNKKYFYRIKMQQFNISYSVIKSIITVPSNIPVITNIEAVIASLNSFVVKTTTKTQAENASNLVQVSTDTNFSTLLQQNYSNTSSANTTATGSTLFYGLTSGAKYYYRTIASNTSGNDTSMVKSITLLTTSPYSNATIAEFDFNNSYSSKSNNVSFASNSKTSFTTDRNNNLNSALLITDTNTVANIPNLPQFGWDRTVSLWVKSNTFTYNQSRFFEYGTINPLTVAVTYTNNESDFNSYHSLNIFDYLSGKSPVKATDWNHITFTYSGNVANLYINGVFLATTTFNLGTDSPNNHFSLGNPYKYFNGAIDELKIFNYALSPNAVAGLFSGSITGVEQNLNNKTILVYPNPAKNSITVTEFSQVFDMLGNKVAEGEGNIDVSLLQAGLYIVKSANGTAKLVKE